MTFLDYVLTQLSEFDCFLGTFLRRCRKPLIRPSYCGEELFPQKAVFICAVECQKVATDRIRIETESELWLLSNMKFAHVHCTRILTLNGEEVTSVTECRNFVGIIKGKEDLFVDAQNLFEVLDDAGMFEALVREKEKEDEQDK